MNKIYFKSVVERISKRHNLNEKVKLVLHYCYDVMYQKYGRKIPTIEYNSDVTYDAMGIMFTEDIDSNYLNSLSVLFEDYEYHAFDYLYYPNIISIDIEKIISKYPNLSQKIIRQITMYAMNEEVRDKLFASLNQKDPILQEKICKWLLPLSLEMFTSNFESINGIADFKEKLKNPEYEFQKEYLDQVIDQFKQSYFTSNKNLNLYFIWQFEFLFQLLYLTNQKLVDNKTIDILLQIREYIIENIPTVSGQIKRIPQYKCVSYDVMDEGANRENAWYPTHTESEMVYAGDEKINSISYSQKEILNIKKTLLSFIPMALNNKYDYQELMKCNCGDYISELIKLLENKENKEMKKCK